MSDKLENPRAFPMPVNSVGDAGYEGMTLRDYFAAQALGGILAHHGGDVGGWICDKAYEVADVMLKVRQS